MSEKNNHLPSQANKCVKLRKFPFPYQAALSICSDIDGTTFENFVKIHQFLNTKQETEFGTGLDLPVGNSFWMYDKPHIVNQAFSYFQDLNGNLSENASVMRDFMKAGILDVMHSYGNFAAISDFSRKIAQQALEELDKYGLKIETWTNHGGIESVQNIGKNSFGSGDCVDSEFYHTDLLLNYGVRFYWDSEYSLMTNIGQDCQAKFSDAFWKSPLYQTMSSRTRSFLKGMLEKVDKVLFPFLKRHIIYWESFDKNINDLIISDVLNDGQHIFKFKRVGLGRFDYSDDIPRLLNPNVICRLIEKNGSMILYVHLGDRRNEKNTLPLSKQTVSTLRNLAHAYHDNQLWVTTTSRLLNYNLTLKTLKWAVEEDEDRLKINLFETKKNREYDLDGLTFYIPENKEIEIIYKDKSITYLLNPPDEQKQKSVSIPISSLEWPL